MDDQTGFASSLHDAYYYYGYWTMYISEMGVDDAACVNVACNDNISIVWKQQCISLMTNSQGSSLQQE